MCHKTSIYQGTALYEGITGKIKTLQGTMIIFALMMKYTLNGVQGI